MSELRADTITASDGTSPVTLTKQSAAKSWVHCNQSTPVIDDSFNSASLTDDGTGLSTIAFTNNMNSVSFSAHCTHNDNTKNAAVGAFAAASYRLDSRNDAATFADQTDMCGTVHGDLA